MKTAFLDFEQPIAELEAKIEELRFAQDDSATDISEEIQRLQKKSAALTKEIYGKLTPWQVAQVARHPQRPYTLDYTAALFSDFEELHGDRSFADDPSIVGGLARFNGQSVVVIGHQKGRDTKEKIFRNFGMPRPEGYRKAMRLMRLAERFGIPVLSFVDTPGAYPGIGAEERGQAEAIGRNLYVMAELRVPIVCTVIGEGGSGGALAIAVGDIVMMLQYATYSVIFPGAHLALGLSGGVDSVALLSVLLELPPALKVSLRAVHVNHGISPNAARWAEFCTGLCARFGIALQLETVDIGPYRNLGLEGAARQRRHHA